MYKVIIKLGKSIFILWDDKRINAIKTKNNIISINLNGIDILRPLPYVTCPKNTAEKANTNNKTTILFFLRITLPTVYQSCYFAFKPLHASIF